jgi:hypothetical protein
MREEDQTIWMEHGTSKGHHWWCIREVIRKLKLGWEEAAFIRSVTGTNNHNFPMEDILIITKTN